MKNIFGYLAIISVSITLVFASEQDLIRSASSLLPETKLMHKHESPHNLTSLVYRTSQSSSLFESAIKKKLGEGWEKIEDDEEVKTIEEGLKSRGLNVISFFRFKNKKYDFQSVTVLYVKRIEKDDFSHTVVVSIMHVPQEFK
ncbi:hypothetical protein Ga0100231_015500 [Opitutaceae bacterium TAV4]|nr:hypothetical protein Ga0100231_015500 [Opitutaceae bacterium TAV4]RRJ99664.1 hypothetical protein Ga0100230_016330 [Opitutaceae bacterium TAV3]